MILQYFLLFCYLAGCAAAASCDHCVDSQNVPSTHVLKTYHESNEHVENPHRGFVFQKGTNTNHHNPLTKSDLDHTRQRYGMTMVWRTYVLESFVSSRISDDYLNKIRADLAAAESASFTLVLRFCYIFSMRHDHPYGDATKNIMLQHIGQLKPIFHQYERVITSIEAGFIGAWGEWHHSEHLNDVNDRKEILLAILHAAPKSIQVQLRYPHQKMEMMGSGTASIQCVQRGDDHCRTGHHNDCFISSDMDVGTYHDKSVEYPFLEKDTRYLIMGGETCSLTNNHRHECPTATKEMAMFHWTFLNEGYNNDIYNVWRKQGCFQDVHKKLGYRLIITKAVLPKSVDDNGQLCFHLEFNNNGYAAPIKALKLYLILKSTSGSHYYAAQVPNVEVRDWQPKNTQTVETSFHVTHVPAGQYKVLLGLLDPLMGQHADYNVLLASSGVPMHAEGLNDLGHTLTVTSHHGSGSSCPALSSWNAPSRGHYSRVFNGPYTS